MANDSWISWLGPWFGGGLAGAFVTLATQKFTKWWEKPILVPGFGIDGDGSIINEPSPDAVQRKRQWVRLKVKNNGRSTARNVRVIIGSIGNKTSDQHAWDFTSEVIDCGWSHIDEFKIDIPPDTWRFADLFVLETTETNADVKFTGRGARNIPGRIEVLSITTMITADNCETKTDTLPLRFQGLEKGMTFMEDSKDGQIEISTGLHR